jgi:hypothetical protein
MRHRPQRIHCLLGLLGQGRDSSRDLVGALPFGDRPGDPQLHLESDHLLLSTVMQVTLQPMTLGILGSDQPPPRGADLLRSLLQLTVQADVAQQQPGPRRNI